MAYGISWASVKACMGTAAGSFSSDEAAVLAVVEEDRASMTVKMNEILNNVNANEEAVETLTNVANNITQMVIQLKTFAILNSLTSALESRVSDHLDTEDLVRRRIALCESGVVNNELLPKALLSTILSKSTNKKTLPLDWYYQALKVSYIFRDDRTESLVCKIAVPMLDDSVYLSYQVNTYPVLYETWASSAHRRLLLLICNLPLSSLFCLCLWASNSEAPGW